MFPAPKSQSFPEYAASTTELDRGDNDQTACPAALAPSGREETVVQRTWAIYDKSPRLRLIIGTLTAVVAFAYPIHSHPLTGYISGFIILPLLHLWLVMPALRFRWWFRRSGLADNVFAAPLLPGAFLAYIRRQAIIATLITTAVAWIAVLQMCILDGATFASIFDSDIELFFIFAAGVILLLFQWVVFWGSLLSWRVGVAATIGSCMLCWLALFIVASMGSHNAPDFLPDWVAIPLVAAAPFWIIGYFLYQKCQDSYENTLRGEA